MRNSDLKANGLYFRVCVNASKRVVVERKYKEFEFLRQALARAFPGCYVPRLLHSDLGSVASALNLSGDLPQGYLERRKFQVQCRNIEVFCQKISEQKYLIESGNPYQLIHAYIDIFKLFMNK